MTNAISSSALEAAIFAPAISLESCARAKGTAKIILGAENMYWEEKGAFTGEISPVMIKEVGCTHVIIGHSERRHIFHETNEEVNKKVIAALANELTPVMCVGELLQDRESGKTFDVIKTQIVEGIKLIEPSEVAANVIIAYEPVWAIGTGKTASSEDAEEVCAYIRKLIAELCGSECADKVIILYGGSVKSENTSSIMAQNNIDGVLVGGASLKVDSFTAIIEAAL
ncbi:MAG: triose-phosphate isomerase [Synergistaceae bacterium]|nr:triose-phosphate isomerase [Synergistaceae bacterium]